MLNLLVIFFLYQPSHAAEIEKISASFSNIDKSCTDFLTKIESCKPSKCSFNFNIDSAFATKFLFKIGPKEAGNNNCPVYFSGIKTEKQTLAKYSMGASALTDLKEFTTFVLNNPGPTILEVNTDCCTENAAAEPKFCDAKTGKTQFKNFAEFEAFNDCKSRKPLKSVVLKVIKTK